MNARIKERNKLAKSIFVHKIKTTPISAFDAANELMSIMYGNNWDKEDKKQQSQPTYTLEKSPIVSIAEQDGEKGVRLCVGDVDIFIEAHNLDNGEEFEWKKAMARLEEVGKRTFDKHEMYLIAAYKDEINAKLKEIGGDVLNGYCWSSTEYNSANAWYVNFFSGNVTGYNKYTSWFVRPCAAFKS